MTRKLCAMDKFPERALFARPVLRHNFTSEEVALDWKYAQKKFSLLHEIAGCLACKLHRPDDNFYPVLTFCFYFSNKHKIVRMVK